jgi:hypothetical protein
VRQKNDGLIAPAAVLDAVTAGASYLFIKAKRFADHRALIRTETSGDSIEYRERAA